MKRMYLVVLLLLAAQGCGKDDPGNIKLSLKLDSTVTNAIQNSIEQFVFVIGKAGSTKLLLYPSACLSCTSNKTPCPVADQCLKTTSCGFSSDDASFKPEINFSDVNQGDNMDVYACALDNTTTPVSSGKGQVKNTAGTSKTITMTSNTSICINQLPPVCS